MLHWVVPQLMNAIDDEGTDIDRLMDTIVNGILHHPAQRELGSRGVREGRSLCFESVKEWWNEMGDDQREDYRRKLSRSGVKNTENHKEGVYDTGHGHGCSGKLKMRKLYGEPETLEDKIAGQAADAIFQGATTAISGMVEQNTGRRNKEEGGLGGLLNAAGSLLGGAFSKDETESHSSRRRHDDGSYTESQQSYGQSGDRYGQAERTETQYSSGGRDSEYRRYEQQESSQGTSGYGYEERTESRPSYGGGYEQRTERHEYRESSSGYEGRHGGGEAQGYYNSSSSDNYGRQEGYGGGSPGRRDEDSYGGRREDSYGGGRQEGYGGGGYERRDEDSYGGRHGGGGYERREEGGYGGGGYERREEGYGRRDDNEYGGRQEGYGGDGGYGRRDDDDRRGGYGGGGGYGGEERRW